MTLSADEFIRRFLLHVLPKGFHRIRHYGLLASAGCKANIARARELIAAPNARTRPADGARHRRSGCRDRSSPAPLLRRPHDHCRGLWALRPTARPAPRRRERDLNQCQSLASRCNIRSSELPGPGAPLVSFRHRQTPARHP